MVLVLVLAFSVRVMVRLRASFCIRLMDRTKGTVRDGRKCSAVIGRGAADRGTA